jgi:hypothetical protein
MGGAGKNKQKIKRNANNKIHTPQCREIKPETSIPTPSWDGQNQKRTSA